MPNNVSVEKALARGKRMVNYPVCFILFGFPAIAIFLFVRFQINGWLTTVLCISGFVGAWLWWSFAIPKWRLWAFTNVRNVHELQRRAIDEQLIWPNGSFFNRTEIWPPAQKQQWAALQANFAQDDLFEDDLGVPPQTEISFSKFKSAGALVMGILFFGLGFYLYTEDGSTWVSWMALITGPGVAIYGLANLRNQTPQITLSDDGVKLANSNFYNWIDVKWAGTEVISGNKGGGSYFIFMTFDGRKSIDIAELDINRTQLDTLIKVYRGRSNKKFAGRTKFNDDTLPRV